MKNILTLLAIFSLLLFSCEKDDIIPPDDPELFTDITYEVVGEGITFSDINYGDLKYSLPNYPDSLHWEFIHLAGEDLPWSKTVNTCTGHPVKLTVTHFGDKGKSLTLKIFDDGVLVVDSTMVSNGIILGGIQYNIPNL